MEYLINNYSKILELLLQHLFISFTAFFFSLLIAVPIGIVASKYSFINKLISKLFGLIYIIPSMALFALLIPITGLGSTTAVLCLILYSQFILIRNIVKGLSEIPPALIEAGLAVGFNSKQLLLKVKIPAVMPIFLAGVRTAVVSIISLTTLAAWINAGGLGVLIFEGLSQDNSIKILIGTVLTASISLFANLLIMSIEKRYCFNK